MKYKVHSCCLANLFEYICHFLGQNKTSTFSTETAFNFLVDFAMHQQNVIYYLFLPLYTKLNQFYRSTSESVVLISYLYFIIILYYCYILGHIQNRNTNTKILITSDII